jgi:hypothetical protein
MVGGAAGGVHRCGHGRPRYAQVRGTKLPNFAADLGRPPGFRPGLFPIVLPLLCPLFLRAVRCIARSSVMKFSTRLSMACGEKSVRGRGGRAYAPTVFVLLFTMECCSAAAAAARRVRWSAFGRPRRKINREIQGIDGPPAPCPAAGPDDFPRPRLRNQQRSASGHRPPIARTHYARRRSHCAAKTCAQIASMPINNASDVSAAASSTTARTITRSSLVDRTRTLFYFCSGVK